MTRQPSWLTMSNYTQRFVVCPLETSNKPASLLKTRVSAKTKIQPCRKHAWIGQESKTIIERLSCSVPRLMKESQATIEKLSCSAAWCKDTRKTVQNQIEGRAEFYNQSPVSSAGGRQRQVECFPSMASIGSFQSGFLLLVFFYLTDIQFSRRVSVLNVPCWTLTYFWPTK